LFCDELNHPIDLGNRRNKMIIITDLAETDVGKEWEQDAVSFVNH
jgi:hypothetical protein